jgi:pyruvate, orthophosphate dikinase
LLDTGQKMKQNIHFFSTEKYITDETVIEKFGIRGKQANEFAGLDLPVLPGIIIDADVAADLENNDIKKILEGHLKKFETFTEKQFGDTKNPMLVKIVISPNLALVRYPTLHNYGLTHSTLEGFNAFVGKNFGFHEVQFLVKGNLEVERKIAELEGKTKEEKLYANEIEKLEREMNSTMSVTQRAKAMERYKSLLPKGFFKDAIDQLEIALKRISKMIKMDEMSDNDVAILIQPMVYGNYGDESASGHFSTRDSVTGEKKLEGDFFENEFDSVGAEGKDINKISPKYHKQLEKVAQTVEDHFKEIRSIRFTIENKKVWLIEQRPLANKSTQSDIKTLLDLNKRKVVDDKYVINGIKPNQLNEILHPVVDLNSTQKLKSIDGGISGAPGAAIGKVYFSTEGLIDAKKLAQHQGEDTRFILCMPATFAEDVKAIEAATGVLSSEGGYAAHASVVARQYGKVSLVKTDLKITGKKAQIGKQFIKEGDYITLNVPQYTEPQILLGKAELIEPDPKTSGLLELVQIIKKFTAGFHVRVNADTPKDAELAKTFGAEGIGLCRTEHMFFLDDRINVFREMIISDTPEKRKAALKKLKTMQKNDFYKLLKIMEGKEVTIRLLDAPLHEFLPHNKTEMASFMDYLNKGKKSNKTTKAEIDAAIDTLKEFNPMLGHRGCRIAVSYPEIYEMQTEALLEAVYKLKKEKIKVFPEIMIPLIMNENELKLIIYGKKIEGKTYKGLKTIAEETKKRVKASSDAEFKIGTMIELPGAALGAGEIARYAEFFSFGTNDLTQTTLGLSRDDFNSFMPDYTQFDLITGNPFQMLSTQVKELVSTAVRRGLLTRPDLKKGLCGEHGAMPENIRYCIETGLDYVSCSTYSIPIANLAVAQILLEKKEAE